MKCYLAIIYFVTLAVTGFSAVSSVSSCTRGSCTAIFSGFPHVQSDINRFTKRMLDKSFDFLLLSSIFDVYNMDRPGFEKLYRKISDRAWEDTINLIKYQSKRGASVTLEANEKWASVQDVATLLQNNETTSLEFALDYEKSLANEAHRIHKKISHADSSKHYDPDVSHYLDEEIIEYQSGLIRHLSGHITNLNDIFNEASTKHLALQLFDDYLDKAV